MSKFQPTRRPKLHKLLCYVGIGLSLTLLKLYLDWTPATAIVPQTDTLTPNTTHLTSPPAPLLQDTAGELEKPNPPAPFPTPLIPPCEEGGQRMLRFYCTEGGASKPLPVAGRGLGRGLTPPLMTSSIPLQKGGTRN